MGKANKQYSKKAKYIIYNTNNKTIQYRLKMGKITIAGLTRAFKGSGGILSTVAKRIGVTRKAVYDYLERHPRFKEMKLQEEEAIIDMGESGLFGRVQKQDPWAIKYLLSTKGKKRGYVERHEQEITGDMSVNIELVGLSAERLAEIKKKRELKK